MQPRHRVASSIDRKTSSGGNTLGINVEMIMWFALLNMVALLAGSEGQSIANEFSPSTGSTNGGTQITITGEFYSIGEIADDAKVFLDGLFQEYECDVEKQSTSGNGITCLTRPMPEGRYLVCPEISGVRLNCLSDKFEVGIAFTPFINYLRVGDKNFEIGGPPESLITVRGAILTDVYNPHAGIVGTENSLSVKSVIAGNDDCSMIAEGTTDQLHGLTLTGGDQNNEGELTCKIESLLVGIHNLSIDVFWYGVSNQDSNLMKVSGNDELYMYQTFAVITGVSPQLGSVGGGTTITITGRFFGHYDLTTEVYVGGQPCQILPDSLTSTEIKCVTPQSSTLVKYPGSRGVRIDVQTNIEVTESGPRPSGETQSLNWIQDSAAYEYENTHLEVAMTGIFVAPQDDKYKFFVRSANSKSFLNLSCNSSGQVLEIETSHTTKSWTELPSQQTEWKNLKAGQMCRYQAVSYSAEYGELFVGVLRATTKFTSEQCGSVNAETQRLTWSTPLKYATQTITLVRWPLHQAMNELQSINVTSSCYQDHSCDKAYYRIGYRNSPTKKILANASFLEMQDALEMVIPVDYSAISVTAQELNNVGGDQIGITYEVVFTGTMGDEPMLTVEQSEGDVSISIEEITKGVPSPDHFAYEFSGRVTKKILANDDQEENIAEALREIFSAQCHDVLLGLSSEYKCHLAMNYEDPVSNISAESGQRVREREAFCGAFSLKNPDNIFDSERNDQEKYDVDEYPFFCFSHFGLSQSKIVIVFEHIHPCDAINVRAEEYMIENVLTTSEESGAYDCLNLKQIITGLFPYSININILKVGGFASISRRTDLYIDAVIIVSEKPSDLEDLLALRKPPAKSDGQIFELISVKNTEFLEYELTFLPENCAQNLPHITAGNAREHFNTISSQYGVDYFYRTPGWPNNIYVLVRAEDSNGPMTGSFDLRYEDNETGLVDVTEIPANISAKDLEALLESVDGFGDMIVSTEHDSCYGRDFIITWASNPGDKNLLQVDVTNIGGADLFFSITETCNGGAFHAPVNGESSRLPFDVPQVEVIVNGIPSRCDGNCSFSYTEAGFPKLTSVTPATVSVATSITIAGTNLQESDNEESEVKIGGVPCLIDSHSESSIACTTGNMEYGSHTVHVLVGGKGYAQHPETELQVVQEFELISISPPQSYTTGGAILTITGRGLGSQIAVKIGGSPCTVISASAGEIQCIIPDKETEGAASLSFEMDGPAISMPAAFAYSNVGMPVVTSVIPVNIEGPGGDNLTISGTDFGTDPQAILVTIGDTESEILSLLNQMMVIKSPYLSPGSYKLQILYVGLGAADIVTNNIPDITYQFIVTDIEPDEVSFLGGEQMMIRGVGFGADMQVTFGDNSEISCELDCVESTFFTCVIGTSTNTYVIENKGTHSSFGEGYEWSPKVLSVTQGDTVVWKWAFDDQSLDGIKIYQVNDPSGTEHNGGFTSSTRSLHGSYSHRFTQSGIIYTSTGYIDDEIHGVINMNGAIHVKPFQNISSRINIVRKGITAKVGLSNSNGITFSTCHTPTVTGISSQSGASGDEIVIQGPAFVNEIWRVSVNYGNEISCVTTSVNESTIICSPSPISGASLGLSDEITINVLGFGNALVDVADDRNRRYELFPTINAIDPISGSTEGGTHITINGTGFFTDITSIDIGGKQCPITSLQYDTIVCESPKEDTASGAQALSVNVGNIAAICKLNDCSFTYSSALTPSVTSVFPTTVSSDNTAFTFVGTGFDATTTVVIGDVHCNINRATSNILNCGISEMVAGNHALVVHSDNGYASLTNGVPSVIQGAAIATVDKQSGAVTGGTLLTVTGHGFNSSDISVTIGGYSATVDPNTLTNTAFKIRTPPGESGLVDIIVVSNGVVYSPIVFEYDVLLTPTITGISPAEGSVGTSVTITGTLLNTEGVSTVFFGDAECSITSQSPSGIVCETSEPYYGGTKIPVVTIGEVGYADNGGFTYRYILEITRIRPTRGSMAGGETLRIIGEGFSAESIVELEKIKCDVTSATYDEIYCVIRKRGFTALSGSEADASLHAPMFFQQNSHVLGIHVVSGSASFTVFEGISDGEGANFGQVVRDCVNCQEIVQSAGIMSGNAFVTASSFNLIHSGETVSIFEPISPSPNHICLGNIISHQNDIYSKSYACIHRMFAEESSATLLINADPIYVWSIAGSLIQTFTASPVPPTVYKLTGLGVLVGATVPATVKVDENSEVTSTVVYEFSSQKTPIIYAMSPKMGPIDGGTNITFLGTTFSTEIADLSVTIDGNVCNVYSATKSVVSCTTSPSVKSVEAVVEIYNRRKGFALNIIFTFTYYDLWSAQTWDGKVEPEQGDNVTVPAGQILMLDRDTAILDTLHIDGGTLFFAAGGINLNVEQILITNGGKLQVGEEGSSYKDKATITLYGRSGQTDAKKSINVVNGTLDLHGSYISQIWTTLEETAEIGDTQVTVSSAVTWTTGDKIVIASTATANGYMENEEHTIVSVDSGVTLHLEDSLKYRHLGIIDWSPSGVTLYTRAEVGLLSRNIVVRGATKLEDCVANGGTVQSCSLQSTESGQLGGQLIVSGESSASGMPKARISYVEFSYMGGTLSPRQYAIQFNSLGNVNFTNYLRACSIHQTFNRAVNIYRSHRILVLLNVIYDVSGSAIAIDEGTESNNWLLRNIVIFCHQSASLQGDDLTPAAFYISNPDNIVEYNRVAGGSHFGYWYMIRESVQSSSSCVKILNLGSFSKNIVHSQGWYGLWIVQEHTQSAESYCICPENEIAIFDVVVVWNCKKGVELFQTGCIQLKLCLIFNNALAGVEVKLMIFPQWGETGIFDSVIVGYSSISQANDTTLSGIVLPSTDGFLVDDVIFVNFDRPGSSVIATTEDLGGCKQLCGGFHSRFNKISYINVTNLGKFRQEHEVYIEDLDGSLTKVLSPQIVIAQTNTAPPSCVIHSEWSHGNHPGMICPFLRLHRFTWNNLESSLPEGYTVNITNSYGMSTVPLVNNGITDAPGWMVLLFDGQTYQLTYSTMPKLTSLRYDGSLYDYRIFLQSGECNIIVHEFSVTPDHFEIVHGQNKLSKSVPVSCESNVYGDFYFSEDNMRLEYIVTGRISVSRRKRSVIPFNANGIDPTTVNRRVQLNIYKSPVQSRKKRDLRVASLTLHENNLARSDPLMHNQTLKRTGREAESHGICTDEEGNQIFDKIYVWKGQNCAHLCTYDCDGSNEHCVDVESCGEHANCVNNKCICKDKVESDPQNLENLQNILRPNISCEHNYMELSIDKCGANALGFNMDTFFLFGSGPARGFRYSHGVDAEMERLNLSEDLLGCRGKVFAASNGVRYQFKVKGNLAQCNADIFENQTHFAFNHVLRGYKTLHGGKIMKTEPIKIYFSCTYERAVNDAEPMSANSQSRTIIDSVAGSISTAVTVWKDGNYSVPIGEPPIIQVPDPVYVSVVMEGAKDAVLSIDNCTAYSIPDFENADKVNLIVNGCPNDDLQVEIIEIGTSNEVKFSFHSFFISSGVSKGNGASHIYLRCFVNSCAMNQGSCVQDCGFRSHGETRKKRDINFNLKTYEFVSLLEKRGSIRKNRAREAVGNVNVMWSSINDL